MGLYYSYLPVYNSLCCSRVSALVLSKERTTPLAGTRIPYLLQALCSLLDGGKNIICVEGKLFLM